MTQFIASILNWLEMLVATAGYLGIAFATFLENIFPPIPSEVIMLGAGIAIAQGKLTLVGVILAATVGAVIAALVFYAAGYYGGRPLVEKYGKYLRITIKDIEYTETWFTKYGSAVIFFGRFIPIVRTLISFPAGFAKEKLSTFLVYTTAGTIIWFAIFTVIGTFFGEAKDSVLALMEQYETIMKIVLLVLSVGVAIWWYKVKIAPKNKKGKK